MILHCREKISTNTFTRDHLNYQQVVNDLVYENLLLNTPKSKEMCFASINIKHESLQSYKNYEITIVTTYGGGGPMLNTLPKTNYLGSCI